MKIALLHASVLPPKTYGGIERIVMALAHEYTRLGHQVVIASKSGSLIKDYEWVELPAGHGQTDPAQYLPKDIDFLHSHEGFDVKPSIPHLITVHGNGHPGENYWPNTNFLSESHCRNHNGHVMVYNGVNPDSYPFVEKKQDYFVFLARTTWRVKNVKTAIDWAQDLGVRLEIMGGSGLSRGGIRYHGLVDETQKLELLAHARALIYPTNWDEPCAAAPLEALACGTPVISSVNGCMPELVRPGTGVVAASYAELLAAADGVSAMKPAACRAAVEEYFSLKRMAADYLKLIETICAQGELKQNPHYNFDPSSVKLLYKPTILNRLSARFRGKI